MAGHGSGDLRAGGSGPDAPVPAEAWALAPEQTLRSWDAAEARLFPLVMARPEAYERSLALIQVVLGWLRSNCPDIPALLAESERGAAIVADAAGGPRGPGGPGEDAVSDDRTTGSGPDDRDLASGVRLDLVAAAACAMRYRELTAVRADRERLKALASARARGASWAVVEESGDEARAPYLPYHRVEAHVPSGRAVIISIEPDETLSRAVRRIDEAALDLASGRLIVGAELGSYAGADEFDDALVSARQRLS